MLVQRPVVCSPGGWGWGATSMQTCWLQCAVCSTGVVLMMLHFLLGDLAINRMSIQSFHQHACACALVKHACNVKRVSAEACLLQLRHRPGVMLVWLWL